MVVLKRIKAATLVETLTATVLIVIVFMVASVILNNIFSGTVKREHSAIESRIKELQYLMLHEKITIPYAEDFGAWEIEVYKENKAPVFSYRKIAKNTK